MLLFAQDIGSKLTKTLSHLKKVKFIVLVFVM